MGAHDKLLGTILRGASDANIAFEDLRKLFRHLGFDERTRGSHHLFRKSGIIELINLQREGAKPRCIKCGKSWRCCSSIDWQAKEGKTDAQV